MTSLPSKPASAVRPLTVGLCMAIGALGLGLLGAPSASFAISLDQARAQGLVCEGADGLLQQRGGGGDVGALVSSTNAQRMAVYNQTAAQQGVPVNQIQAVSGGRLRGQYPGC